MKKIFFLILIAILSFSVSAGKIHPNLEKFLDKDESISVIVQFEEKPGDEHRNILSNAGCISGYVARHMNLIVADCPGRSLQGLSQANKVQFIWEDEFLSTTLDVSAPQISAPDAWNLGYNGSGINVALIDTGVNSSLPAFGDRIVLEKDFTTDGFTHDICDHGTHTASVLVSQNSTYRGIAHGANMFNAKAGTVVPPSSQCGFSTSKIIEAIDWSVVNGAHVIAIIAGSPIGNCSFSTIANYINETSPKDDIAIMLPAGNGGPSNGSIWTPGCSENGITVGAVDDNNVIASFSSRGPVIEEITRMKPDVVAPGVGIISAHQTGGFDSKDGTSLSTPHAAGIAVLLLQANPGLSFKQVKDVIKNSSKDLGYAENIQGKGLVNATAAIDLALNTTPDDFSGALFYYLASLEPEKPKVRNILSDNTFSSETPLLSLGSDADAIWVRAVESPVRNETAIVTQDDLSSINVQIRKYQGPRNLKKLTNNTGGNAERRFDVAYESSGRAIVVYGNNTAVPAYEIWDGFNYVASGTLASDDCAGTVTWVELSANPAFSEVVAVYQDSNGNYCGQVWNGSSWGNVKKFDTDAGTSTQKFDVAHESSSGHALAVFESATAGRLGYCEWAGSSWCSSITLLADRGGQNDWVKLASQGSSDRILVGVFQPSPDKDVEAIEWNGTAFGTWKQVDNSVENTAGTDRIVDVAYIGTSGKGMFVYLDNDAAVPSYTTCASASDCFAGTWAAVATTTSSSNNCGEQSLLDYIGLVPDPLSDKLLLYGITQGNHTKCTQFYDGGWGAWNSNVSSGSAASNAEDITAVFDKV